MRVRRGDAGSSGVCTVGEPGECGLGFDSECPWEQQCLNGRCTTLPPLGAACGSISACGSYLVCAKGSEDGGSCAPPPRRGDRCIFTEPDGGFPRWRYSCVEGTCNSSTRLCE